MTRLILEYRSMMPKYAIIVVFKKCFGMKQIVLFSGLTIPMKLGQKLIVRIYEK